MMRVVDRHIGMLLAMAIGLLMPIGERAIVALALNRSLQFSGEVDSIAINAVLVAIPFLTLAFRSPSHLGSWVIAFASTTLVHGWWLSKGIAYQRAPDGSGVDMGGALMMLFSPLPIACIAVAVDIAFRGQAKRS